MHGLPSPPSPKETQTKDYFLGRISFPDEGTELTVARCNNGAGEMSVFLECIVTR